jgi:hypothetical protein
MLEEASGQDSVAIGLVGAGRSIWLSHAKKDRVNMVQGISFPPVIPLFENDWSLPYSFVRFGQTA